MVDNAHVRNTGGEHSVKLFTEAERQGDDRRIRARNLEQEQSMNSPAKEKLGLVPCPQDTEEKILGKQTGDKCPGMDRKFGNEDQ